MIIKKWLHTERLSNGYVLHCDAGDILIIFLTEDVFRIRASFTRDFPEESYALVTTCWEDRLDELFQKERVRREAVMPRFSENEEKLVFETSRICVEVRKEPVGVSVFDKAGACIYADVKNRAMEKDHLGRVLHYSRLLPTTHFYGFGEQAGPLDKRGRRLRLTGKDAIGHDPENACALYMNIPFYTYIDEETGTVCGMFYNNSHDSVFDLGNEISGYYERYYYYQADGGDIDWFFLYGPGVKQVLDKYTMLTGKMAMPTKQSLGYTASTMYYMELDSDCDKRICEVIDSHFSEGLCIDNFKMASGYTSGEKDNLRYVFNWNHRRIPDPRKFCKTMEEQGINLIPNIKPGILKNHPYAAEFEQHGAFIRNPDGSGDYYGAWWGGAGRFLDFTNPSARTIWKKLMEEKLLSYGLKTIWNDNCEYDGVEDRTAICCNEGRPDTMVSLKCIQANMMAYCGKEAIDEVYPDERPYQINRAGFAGIQRYAQVWGGDNLTDWRTLRFNIDEILGMGLSGLANTGCDIGGFAGGAPEPELLLRWIQNGIFQPRFCINSANDDNTVTQPWMHGGMMPYVRQAFSLRYRMIPYLYSLAFEAHTTGTPIMRPLFMEFPGDRACLKNDCFEFMFGSALLVANVVEKGAQTRKVYLPAGAEWYDLEDSFRAYSGGQTIEKKVSLSSIPRFLRDAAILVLSDDIHHISSDYVRTLKVYVSNKHANEFTYYEDDGHSRQYENGGFCKTVIAVSEGKIAKVRFTESGDFRNRIEKMEVYFVSKGKSAKSVSLQGEALPEHLVKARWTASEKGWYYDAEAGLICIKYPKPQERDYEVTVSTERFDLIGMKDDE